MELNLPEYRLLSPSSREPLCRTENFIAKIGDFCLLVSTFSRLEQSYGQIVLTMKVPFYIFHSQMYLVNSKKHHVKVLLKKTHLNGNTIGFPLQTQKLELLYKTSYGLWQ